MAHPVGLSPEQFRILDSLKGARGLKGLYLAGGTAVAWHFAHRRSADLDLFTASPKQRLETIEAAIKQAVPSRKISESEVSLSLRSGQTAIDVVRYPYARLQKAQPGPGGFAVAGPMDLGAMKLAAISKRGLRRDFWDLYVICTQGRQPLKRLLTAYRRKFEASAADEYHVVRALTFFDDAEADDPRLVGLSSASWRTIKEWFCEHAPAGSSLRLPR